MMQGGLPETLTNHVTPRVFGSNNCLIWNEQVLLAIQRMKYNVDACKEVRGCKVEGVRGCEVERVRGCEMEKVRCGGGGGCVFV